MHTYAWYPPPLIILTTAFHTGNASNWDECLIPLGPGLKEGHIYVSISLVCSPSSSRLLLSLFCLS